MCVFVIEVNWQISAAERKTSPSAISLKRRSSRPLAAQRHVFGNDIDEGGANGVAHRLRAADVDVAVSGEQAPDERALLADPVLDVVAAARPLARGRDVNVVEHSFGREPPDFVAV